MQYTRMSIVVDRKVTGSVITAEFQISDIFVRHFVRFDIDRGLVSTVAIWVIGRPMGWTCDRPHKITTLTGTTFRTVICRVTYTAKST